MQFKYDSPLGELKLDVSWSGVCALRLPTSDPEQLAHAQRVTEFLLEVERNCFVGYRDVVVYFNQAKKWLDLYFLGKKPDFMPELHMLGSKFQKNVWKILEEIPYGESISYGSLTKKYKERYQVEAMSNQAIGQAVGANQLPIFIPCHRVLGSKNKIGGFAYGVDKKAYLLGIEQISWRP